MLNLRKFNLLVFFLLSCLCTLSEKAFAYPAGTELRLGAFFPTDGHNRKALNTPLPVIEIESSYHLNSCWDMWTAVGYIYGSGRTCDGHRGYKQSISIVPITIGARRFFCLGPNWDAFLGVGGVWSLYNEEFRCRNTKQRINKSNLGAVIRGGYQYVLAENFIMEFTAEYLFQWFHFHRISNRCKGKNSADWSGTKFGFGIMYDF